MLMWYALPTRPAEVIVMHTFMADVTFTAVITDSISVECDSHAVEQPIHT